MTSTIALQNYSGPVQFSVVHNDYPYIISFVEEHLASSSITPVLLLNSDIQCWLLLLMLILEMSVEVLCDVNRFVVLVWVIESGRTF